MTVVTNRSNSAGNKYDSDLCVVASLRFCAFIFRETSNITVYVLGDGVSNLETLKMDSVLEYIKLYICKKKKSNYKQTNLDSTCFGTTHRTDRRRQLPAGRTWSASESSFPFLNGAVSRTVKVTSILADGVG